ncbi:MAG: DUF84 family protein [Candidatus Falkowbacteria bacterium]
MNIVLGSTSEQKIQYLQEVLQELKLDDFNIVAVDVPSGVSDQPMSSDETLSGSIARARSAFELKPNFEISLGIEVGYALNDNQKYEILCWTTVFDGKKEFPSKSNHFLLPEFHQKLIKSGSYLGDHVRDFYDENDNSFKKLLGDLIIYRNAIIKNSIFNSLLYYLNKNDYQTFK